MNAMITSASLLGAMSALIIALSGAPTLNAAGTAKGGGSALIGADRQQKVVVAETARPMACPKCKTETVRRTEISSKGSQAQVKTIQRHSCPSCKTTVDVQGHGKMKRTVASHSCSEAPAGAKNCCANR